MRTNVVKDYRGIKIFVYIDGTFYCNMDHYPDYKKKTFQSNKLASIEKAIDEYHEKVVDGSIYYDIVSYIPRIHRLKVIGKVGSRLFFDDGTSSMSHNRQKMYPKDIETTAGFLKLKALFDDITANKLEINRLNQENTALMAEANKITSKLKKIEVTA